MELEINIKIKDKIIAKALDPKVKFKNDTGIIKIKSEKLSSLKGMINSYLMLYKTAKEILEWLNGK